MAVRKTAAKKTCRLASINAADATGCPADAILQTAGRLFVGCRRRSMRFVRAFVAGLPAGPHAAFGRLLEQGHRTAVDTRRCGLKWCLRRVEALQRRAGRIESHPEQTLAGLRAQGRAAAAGVSREAHRLVAALNDRQELYGRLRRRLTDEFGRVAERLDMARAEDIEDLTQALGILEGQIGRFVREERQKGAECDR